MPDATTAAIARLRRDLFRRRRQRLDRRLRVEIAALAAMFLALAFWQSRVRFASIAFDAGRGRVALVCALVLALLAAAGGVATAIRLRRRLSRRPPGPPWACLPVAWEPLVRHQAWEAEHPLRWLALPAAAVWCAATGIAAVVPWIVMAFAFPLLWLGCCRAGAAMARAWATRTRTAPLEALADAWSAPPRSAPAAARDVAFVRRTIEVALCVKDLTVTLRAPATRWRFGASLALALLSVALWGLPGPFRGLVAPAVALAAAAAFGEWLIGLGSHDPFPVLRALPLGVGTIWRARLAWGIVFTLLIVVAHALAARAPALEVRVATFWLGIATLSIAALAVQLQITLYPRADQAFRLFAVSLVLAVACSLMIPLVGWAMLFGAVIRTALRLPRWWRLEERA